MSADQRCHSSILGKLAAPPRCWCCERPFGESGVVQLPAYREWLAYQCDSDIPPAGICEECASERNACLRCGRVPGLEADGNPYLQTWELKDSDEERLQAAGLEELTAYCEPCLVRDYLMDDEFMEDSLAGKKSNLPKNVAFGLAMIIARHWGKSLYVKEQGLSRTRFDDMLGFRLASAECSLNVLSCPAAGSPTARCPAPPSRRAFPMKPPALGISQPSAGPTASSAPPAAMTRAGD